MTLHIHDLAYERNNELLFSDMNCLLQTSEMLQVKGANGSGKSTFLRILAGYIRPEIGHVLWQNHNIFQQLDDYTQQICYIGHQNGIKPYLTVYENLKLNCALMNKKISDSQLKTVLRTMGLDSSDKTQAIYLSAGQKRRLALSRLQFTSARLWILDEPTTALDQSGQFLLVTLLQQHLAQGGMAVVATHQDLNVVGTLKTLHVSQAVARETLHV